MEHYEQSNLRFWPLESMARFGQNPFGENLWRIVHAPSRRSLVHGYGRKPKWLPTYPQAGQSWVLEKWLSAYEFTKCTAETWNMGLTILGPYPSRGEYEVAHIFESLPPSDVNLDKVISWIEAGKRYSSNENRNAMKDEMAKEDTDKRKYWKDRLLNCLPAFGSVPMSGLGGGRGTKTIEFAKTAHQIDKPASPGHMTARPTKQQFDVSHLIEGVL